jgi:hypothetical protein
MNTREDTDRTQQDGFVDAVGDMVDTYRKLVNIRIVENVAAGGSVSILGILLLVIGVFALLFGGLGIAWWIGERWGDLKIGFFIVGGFYLITLLVILLVSSSVVLPWLRNLIMRKIYEQV